VIGNWRAIAPGLSDMIWRGDRPSANCGHLLPTEQLTMDRDDYYPPGTPEREIAIRRRVHQLAEFYRHVFVYGIVIGLLWCANAYLIYSGTVPTKWWFWWAIWPTLGWGIGLITHGITVLPVWGLFSQDWEERKVRELLERERK